MSWEDYSKLFDDLLADVVHEYDPETAYWAGSPHSPCGDRNDWNNQTCGDVHLWGVWHGQEPFEWYQSKFHRFISEFGFQSFPQPNTLAPVIAEEDRDIYSDVLVYRQRSGIGNATIANYMKDWFKQPKDFESTLWLSQILQGMAMKTAIEHWRRQMPRTMGTLYWQLNDMWQAPSWSSIDYHGIWKSLHYMARHFYAPVMVSGHWQPENQSVTLHVSNDLPAEGNYQLQWRVVDLTGQSLESSEKEIIVPALSSTAFETLNLFKLIDTHEAKNLIVWMELWKGENCISNNQVLLTRPENMPLLDPQLSYDYEWLNENQLQMIVHTQAAALWVWVSHPELSLNFSDNFFHLLPDTARTITLDISKRQIGEVVDQFKVSSVYDLTE